jgi:hypothetical protein
MWQQYGSCRTSQAANSTLPEQSNPGDRGKSQGISKKQALSLAVQKTLI